MRQRVNSQFNEKDDILSAINDFDKNTSDTETSVNRLSEKENVYKTQTESVSEQIRTKSKEIDDDEINSVEKIGVLNSR